MLLSLTDPSKIVLVDFGLARRINQGEPSKYDPFLESYYIFGTLIWASLNSHCGIGECTSLSEYLQQMT